MTCVRKAAIFTGSRKWVDVDAVRRVLAEYAGCVVIHGACDSGADFYAARFALTEEVLEGPMPAQWGNYGPSAGPRRNAEMLKVLRALGQCGYDISVRAFPLRGSRGTWNMVNLAKAAGVDVQVYGSVA